MSRRIKTTEQAAHIREGIEAARIDSTSIPSEGHSLFLKAYRRTAFRVTWKERMQQARELNKRGLEVTSENDMVVISKSGVRIALTGYEARKTSKAIESILSDRLHESIKAALARGENVEEMGQ